jgi:hypothetical protein
MQPSSCHQQTTFRRSYLRAAAQYPRVHRSTWVVSALELSLTQRRCSIAYLTNDVAAGTEKNADTGRVIGPPESYEEDNSFFFLFISILF